jgi:hypothetical protein
VIRVSDTHAFGLPARRLGLLLALLAVTVQLAAASVMPLRGTRTETLDRLVAASICHGDAGSGQGDTRHQLPDCAMCPFCQAIAHAGILLAPTVVALVAPAVAILRAAMPPPSRAPPARRAAAASARGPPTLS